MPAQIRIVSARWAPCGKRLTDHGGAMVFVLEVDGHRLVVATCNLDRKMPWGPRRKALAKFLGGLGADIICLQESAEFERTLVTDMDGAWFQVSDHVNCPILVRATRLTRHKMGISIDMQGKGRKRYATAVLLKDLKTGAVICAVTWHPSNVGEYGNLSDATRGQAKQAGQLLDQVEPYADGRAVLTVILGDTNSKLWAPQGPAGVLVKAGYTDLLAATGASARIDRGFSRGASASGAIKDGPVSIARLVGAWRTGKVNNEALVWQTWLARLGFYQLKIDGQIGPRTKAATFAARRRYFPAWSTTDIESEPGRKTVERVRDAAKSPRDVVA